MTGQSGHVPLRDYLDLRFNALDERLERLDDHETRIRSLERIGPFRSIAEIVIGLVAGLAAVVGIKTR